LHVVVVDDEEGPRALFSDILAMVGARVTVASSAREALAIIERDRPDVLVSDIMMPGEDGYWLIKAVRLLTSDGTALCGRDMTPTSVSQWASMPCAPRWRGWLGAPDKLGVVVQSFGVREPERLRRSLRRH
jgi:hypothetical protein